MVDDKDRHMQCKDIPDAPILERIWEINKAFGWAFRFWLDTGENERCPLQAFPDQQNTPEKLAMAKYKALIRKGLIDGCGCGCRGDFVLTDKGCEVIGKPWHGLNIY